MPETPPYARVSLVRHDLLDLPDYALPDGFGLRTYRPGDDETWIAVHNAADDLLTITRETFDESLGYDADALPGRMFFLLAPDGREIGSCTAWYATYDGVDYGLVHWLGIIEEFRGQGLAKPLLARVMRRLAESHQRAWLGTSTVRVRAINLYLKFGFVPVVTTDEQRAAWRMAAPYFDHPALDPYRA